jgi:hypothetical protein
MPDRSTEAARSGHRGVPARPTGLAPTARAALMVASTVATLFALTACFPCEGATIAFPDHPIVVQGTWAGVGASTLHPDVDLDLVLDVAFLDTRIYLVSGVLEVDGVPFDVEGAVRGYCEQQFVPSADVARATPAPLQPQLEATLYDDAGRRVGSLLAYRILVDEGDYDVMTGQVRLDEGAGERSYSFQVERP